MVRNNWYVLSHYCVSITVSDWTEQSIWSWSLEVQRPGDRAYCFSPVTEILFLHAAFIMWSQQRARCQKTIFSEGVDKHSRGNILDPSVGCHLCVCSWAWESRVTWINLPAWMLEKYHGASSSVRVAGGIYEEVNEGRPLSSLSATLELWYKNNWLKNLF